ncbi:Crp/Fnr family transcriptional regulator [uncultured Desulfuromusa sp.]
MKYFYVIVSGRIKISQINPDTGREFAFLLLGPGDVFDVICLVDDQEHLVQIDILEDVQILYIFMREVRFWIQNHADFNKTLC